MTFAAPVFRFSVADLMSRPSRALLTIAGIAIAVGALVALDGLVRGFEKALTSTISTTGSHVHVMEKGSIDFFASVVPETVAEQVRKAPGVEAASPVLIKITSLRDGTTVPVLGWPSGSYLWASNTIVSGRLPKAGTGGKFEIVVGFDLARKLASKIGDEIEILGIPAQIVGIAQTSSQLNRAAIFALLEDVQAATFRKGQATSVIAKLTPAALADIKNTLRALSGYVEGYQTIDSETLSRDNFVLVLTRALSRGVAVVALSLTFFGVLSNLWATVKERRHEFAILRSIGWPVGRIARFILYQAWIMASLGIVSGIALGVFGAMGVAKLPEVAAYIEPDFTGSLLIWTAVLTFFTSALGIVPPLWAVARLDPAAVLRST